MIDRKIIEQRLSTTILSFNRLSGGDINNVFQCETSEGSFVLKKNDRNSFPKMLKKEAQGLELLRKANVHTPNIIDQFDFKEHQYLVLEWIKEASFDNNYWATFGMHLSKLHQQTTASFGLGNDNYIGSLVQENHPEQLWETFFVERRIMPLVQRAFDNGLLEKRHLKKFQQLYRRFGELVPREKPSLLHGDLWSGNLLCSFEQQPVFIDPAVYYGHREVDIAMTFMFGGFNPLYLSAYNEQFPLEKGWEKRVAIHNLYPSLVHLILFGLSYRGSIDRVLEKI